MEIERSLLRVQSAYPRIYLACHSRHQNSRTTPEKLSQRDVSLLAHLEEDRAIPQSELGRHMGLAKSTLSEALATLEEQGFIAREADPEDSRGCCVRRTSKGSAAMSNGSVLESARLRRILKQLTEHERQLAVDGLELLARACEGSLE